MHRRGCDDSEVAVSCRWNAYSAHNSLIQNTSHWIHFVVVEAEDGEIVQTTLWKMWAIQWKVNWPAASRDWEQSLLNVRRSPRTQWEKKWETSWRLSYFRRFSGYKMGYFASICCVVEKWKVMGDPVRVTGYEMGPLLGQVRYWSALWMICVST